MTIDVKTFAQRLRGDRRPNPGVSAAFAMILTDTIPAGRRVASFASALTGRRKPSGERVRQFAEALAGRVPVASIKARSKTVRLLESDCRQDGSITADDFLLKNARVLGAVSLNGRRYTREAMGAALSMYDGARVYLDHREPGKVGSPRSVKDLIGTLEGPSLDDAGVLANMQINPEHPHARAIAWIAKNRPDAIGFSHDAVGQGETVNGVFVIDRIVSVKSVDLVTDPATVAGLYS
jgi:hypothetical protein